MGQWYLGPSGALVAIPQPLVGLDASPELIGSVSTSINGARTIYRVSQPRTWQMRWTMLTEDQITYLRLVGHGLVTSPLRLIVGEIRNRLPVRVAAAGSYSKAGFDFDLGHFTGAAAPTWVPITDPPATVPVRGVVSWARPTAAVADLTVASSTDRVPLLPTLEQIRVSMWVRGTAINVFASLDVYDSSGTATHVYSAGSTLLDPVIWSNISFTYAPSSLDVEVAPVLHVQSAEPASTIQTTGWQLAPASASTTWSPGGGAPTVIAGSKLSEVYIMDDRRQFDLALLERLM